VTVSGAAASNSRSSDGSISLHTATVTCGDGFDSVFADSKDVVALDCEEVAVGRAAVEEFAVELEESGFFERFFGSLAPFPEG
jgi:hypothetical protein